MAWVLDLDGVLWLGPEPIPGAAAAVARLRQGGQRVLFVTNNSYSPASTVESKLEAMGVPASGDVVTSADAAGTLIRPGERVLTCAGPGAAAAAVAAGATLVDDAPADVVLVGFHPEFDYDGLRRAAAAVRNGARLVATNDDATFPTPTGPIPGGGSILAAVVAASGVTAEVAGKPHRPMADAVRARLEGERVEMVVGDRPDTDGRFAAAMGVRFALVLSGVTTPSEVNGLHPAPALVAPDLAAAVAAASGDPDGPGAGDDGPVA